MKHPLTFFAKIVLSLLFISQSITLTQPRSSCPCAYVDPFGKRCTKKFARPDSLSRHLRQVHGQERPHRCPHCPHRKFKRTQHLTSHLFTVHRQLQTSFHEISKEEEPPAAQRLPAPKSISLPPSTLKVLLLARYYPETFPRTTSEAFSLALTEQSQHSPRLKTLSLEEVEIMAASLPRTSIPLQKDEQESDLGHPKIA